MDDISAAILDTWSELGDRILGDPLELSKRLARRRCKTFRKPLRTWCLAVRSADTRINPATAACVPEFAAYPRDHLHPRLWSVHRYAEHEVTLTAELLRKICRPVRLDDHGNTVEQVCRMLGTTSTGIEYAINQGVFVVEWHKRGGCENRPRRVLFTPHALDPASSSLKIHTDSVWAHMWWRHADRIPDDFEQTLTRVPARHVTRETFTGWRWVCPGCRRSARTIFYPLRTFNMLDYFRTDPSKDELDEIQPPPATFACVRCHGVRYFNPVGPNMWNELIFHMTGGMLYGYEVARPTWLKPLRKKNYTAQLGRAPSKRREEVLERLLKGWSYRQIAQDIGSGYATVHKCVQVIYKQHRVHSRDELIATLKVGATGENEKAHGMTVGLKVTN